MAEPEEANSYQDLMSNHQIIKRLKQLFRRDMAPRAADLLLLDDSTPAEETVACAVGIIKGH